MTIPIRPGPFSFLATLGEAGGKAAESAQKDKDKKLKMAQDRLNQMIQLRSAGLIDPSAFSGPEAMKLYETVGITPISSEQTSGEMSEIFKRSIIGAGDSPEKRSLLGLPTQGAVATDAFTAQKVGVQSQALATGTREQQAAISGVPTELTARAGEEAARDTLNNSLALRSVDAAITRSGGTLENIISVQGGPQALATAAWETAQQDAKMRGYTAVEELTRPYIEAAISSRIRDAQKLAIEKLAAQNRGMSGQDTLGDYLRLLQGQQAQTRQQLSALPKPSDQVQMLSQVYQTALDKALTPEAKQKVSSEPKYSMMRQAYDVMQNYRETQLQLNNELNGYRDQLQNLLGAVTGAGKATPGRESRLLSDATVDAVVQRMRQQKIDVKQLDIDVESGKITAADAAAIKAKLTQGAAKVVKP